MIKNLIFDFGGVLIDIDPLRVGQLFKELGIKDVEKVNELAFSKGLYLDFEKGLITGAEFRDGLREVSSLKLTDAQIDGAWNSMILRFPKSRFDLLKQLKKNYNIYLLSNTNEIHLDYFNQYVINNMGINRLDDLFTECFYSHIMKLRKPDHDIFLKMLETGGMLPSESLYIDDLPENTDAARELGFPSITHNSKEEINQYFVDGRIVDGLIKDYSNFSSFNKR